MSNRGKWLRFRATTWKIWVGFHRVWRYRLNARDRAFEEAIASGHATNVAALVLRGADPDTTLSRGFPVLIYAAQQKHTTILRILLSAGANANIRYLPTKHTAIIVCAKNGDLASVKCLIEFGADVNASNIAGVTALMMAARCGHTDIVQTLLDNQADVNLRSRRHASALDFAQRHDFYRIAELLRNAGAEARANQSAPATDLLQSAEPCYCRVKDRVQ
jgi:ankyrin repeat protein